MILPNGLNFDGVKYPNALKIICCSANNWYSVAPIYRGPRGPEAAIAI